MRRVQNILVASVLVALLASPLALLARSGAPVSCQCCGTYCPMRNAHSTEHGKTKCGSTPLSEHTCICGMRSSQQPDYGLNTIMAPAEPSARARLHAPDSFRRVTAPYAEISLSASASTPFHPPRS